MMRGFPWALVPVVVAGCGSSLHNGPDDCPAGRTSLDGVCVAEAVADYVSCVRAQGATLGAERSEKISAEAGYAGLKAGGAAEVSENLQKQYAASDEAMMKIIDNCNATGGVPARPADGTPTNAQTPAAPSLPIEGSNIAKGWAGEAMGGKWTVRGDELTGRGGHYRLDVGRVGDFTLELEAELVDGSRNGPNKQYGIALRSKPESPGSREHFIGYWFNFDFMQNYQLFSCTSANSCRVLTSDWNKPNAEYKRSPLLGAQLNQHRITFRGQRYEVHVNGKLLDSGDDGAWARGNIMVGAGEIAVTFRNLKVLAP